MQTGCRPIGNLTIGVKSTSAREKCEIFFSKVHYFLCCLEHPVSDSTLGELKNRWRNKAEKNYLHANNIVFLCNDLGKMKLSVDKNIIFFCYTSYLKVPQ